MSLQISNNLQRHHLHSTVVFTSLTPVSGVVAIQKLDTFSIVAVGARNATVWVLEGIEGKEIEFEPELTEI
jgi:hypothetical protein